MHFFFSCIVFVLHRKLDFLVEFCDGITAWYILAMELRMPLIYVRMSGLVQHSLSVLSLRGGPLRKENIAIYCHRCEKEAYSIHVAVGMGASRVGAREERIAFIFHILHVHEKTPEEDLKRSKELLTIKFSTKVGWHVTLI